jgi:MOSC domain-containing protein YiiM
VTTEWHGRSVTTAIRKAPVDGPRHVAGINVDGDDQADRRVHGGPTKAVYAYAVEDYAWWSEELDRPLGPGSFGDNLTIEGLDPGSAVVGERWRVRGAVLRVTEPRVPCFKLGMVMGDAGFVDRFGAADRPGTYLAIDEAGEVGAGDPIEVVSVPDHGLTIGEVNRWHHGGEGGRGLLERVAGCADLPGAWRDLARRRLAGLG